MNTCNLTISDLRLWVHLGCSEEEKYHPQLVRVDLTLSFPTPPLAMTTDRLEETVCYAQIVHHLQEAVEEKRFNLIEHLTHTLYDVVRDYLGEHDVSLKICVNKMAPPVPGVHGGVSFSYGQG